MDNKENNGAVSEKENKGKTALTFEFVEQGGLVFEEEAFDADFSEQIKEALPDRTEEDDIREGEFIIPDEFVSEDKEDTVSESFIEDPKRLRTPYMPKFTSVSENYRMKNDPRPKVKTETSEDKEAIIDATSESSEEGVVEKVIVRSGVPVAKEPTDETITLFKFDPGPDNEGEKEENEGEENTDTAETAELPALTADSEEETKEAEDKDELKDEENRAESESYEVEEISLGDESVGFPSLGESGSRVFELSKEEEPIGSIERADKGIMGVGGEYFSPTQKDSVKDRFLDGIISVNIRLVSAFVLFLAMIVFEFSGAFGKDLYSVFGNGAFIGVKLLVDMAFCSCMLLLTLPETFGAIISLFKGKAVPELFLPVSYAVLLVYGILTLKMSEPSYPTFGILFAVLTLAALYAKRAKIKTEYSVFRTLSATTEKTVLDIRLTRSLEGENMALDGAVDEYKSRIARSFKTGFVSDFCARNAINCENGANVLVMLGIGVGLSLVSAVVCYFLGTGSISYAANAFTVVFMMSCPAFSMLLHKIPFKHVEKEAKKDKGAFIGEDSVYSASDTDVVVYDDVEIFSEEDVSIKKVHMYGKVYNAPKAMHQMYSLFSVVGGPLKRVFGSSIDGKGVSATEVYLEEDGICGVLDGHRILAGTEEFMHRHKVRIPEDESKNGSSGAETMKVMYGAEDGEVYVKFSIRYSFSEEFSMLLPHLKAAGIVPLVYTRDPNLTNDLLKSLTMGEDIIRVMKREGVPPKNEKVYRRISAPVVTSLEKTNAVNMLLLSKKYTAFQAAFGAGELVTMMVGAVLAMVFSLSGVFAMPTYPLALMQLVVCLFLHIKSALTFKTKNK